MAFPSNAGTKTLSLADAWQQARAIAAQVKSEANRILTTSQSGNVPSGWIVRFCHQLADARDQLTALAATPGIGTYAQQQCNDALLNIANEFSAMQSAIASTRTWITTNFPKDGSGYLLERQFDANGRVTERQFDTAALANFRTQLTALIATID